MGVIHSEAFMAKSFPNIDKSGFRRGEYVGYGGRHAWRITKMNPNKSKYKWLAQTVGGQCFYKPTLAEVSKELARLDNTAIVANC
jgi:hypothetical protein